MKEGHFWADRLKTLTKEHEALVEKVQVIEAQMKPLIKMIEKIKEKLNPLIKEASPIHEQLRKLDGQIRKAEAWAYIEALKEGSRLWVLHSTWNRRGIYETIPEEQAQKRFVSRQEQKEMNKDMTIPVSLGYVPHELLILSRDRKMGKPTFIARDNKKRRYNGFIREHLTSQMPRLQWRRKAVTKGAVS